MNQVHSVRVQGATNRLTHHDYRIHEARGCLFGSLPKVGDVCSWDDQGMAGRGRARREKREPVIALGDDPRIWILSRGDFAERALNRSGSTRDVPCLSAVISQSLGRRLNAQPYEERGSQYPQHKHAMNQQHREAESSSGPRRNSF